MKFRIRPAQSPRRWQRLGSSTSPLLRAFSHSSSLPHLSSLPHSSSIPPPTFHPFFPLSFLLSLLPSLPQVRNLHIPAGIQLSSQILLAMVMDSVEGLYNCRVDNDLQANFKSKLFLIELPKVVGMGIGRRAV